MKRRVLSIVLLVVFGGVANSQDLTRVADSAAVTENSAKNVHGKDVRQRKVVLAALRTEAERLNDKLERTSAVAASSASTENQKNESVGSLAQRIGALEIKMEKNEESQDYAFLASQLTSLIDELNRSIDETKALQMNTDKVITSVQHAAQFEGQAFSSYSYTTDGIEGKNDTRFDLDRMYLTAKVQLFDQGKFQLTSDLFRDSSLVSHYSGFSLKVQFAFLDYSPADPVSIKIGVIPGVWSEFMDTYWKYRGLSPNVTDRNGYYPLADIGIQVLYKLPGNIGDVSAFMLNGNGYASPESNRFKDFALRACIAPFRSDPLLAQLVVAAYGYNGWNQNVAGDALPRNRYGAMVSYGYSFATAGVEYDIRTDAPTNADTLVNGNALSVFGEIKAPWVEWANTFSLVWRYDIVNPDIQRSGTVSRFGILGIAFKPHEKLTFVIDRQLTRTESATLIRNDGALTDYDNRWFLHALVTF